MKGEHMIESTPATPPLAPAPERSPLVPVKEGHPRFNLVVLLILVAAFLVFALVQAQRLQV
jgi:hypothetical protein